MDATLYHLILAAVTLPFPALFTYMYVSSKRSSQVLKYLTFSLVLFWFYSLSLVLEFASKPIPCREHLGITPEQCVIFPKWVVMVNNYIPKELPPLNIFLLVMAFSFFSVALWELWPVKDLP